MNTSKFRIDCKPFVHFIEKIDCILGGWNSCYPSFSDDSVQLLEFTGSFRSSSSFSGCFAHAFILSICSNFPFHSFIAHRFYYPKFLDFLTPPLSSWVVNCKSLS